MKEKALSCAGLRDLQLTFSPAWLRNFVAACSLARSTVAYDGGFGVYSRSLNQISADSKTRNMFASHALDAKLISGSEIFRYMNFVQSENVHDHNHYKHNLFQGSV